MSSIDHLSEIDQEWEYPSFDISEEAVSDKLIFCLPECDQCLKFDYIENLLNKNFRMVEENF